MKIYTKTGDRGQTGLIGGARVSKAAARVEAYGAVDELNAALGLAAAGAPSELKRELERFQADLHLICADLASPEAQAHVPRLEPRHVAALEARCDALEAELPPLKRFILPGGTPLGAQLHLARTVARRAERRVVTLAERERVNPVVIPYLNRLSDLLFLLARWVNRQAGVPETHPDYR